MSMRHSLAVGPIAALVGMLALTACGASGTGHSRPPGTSVSGTLRITGGPSGATRPGIGGQVVFTARGKHAATSAATDGRFTTSLAPGTYTVTGTSPQYGDGHGICRAAGSVVVTDTAVTGLVVACSRK